MSYTTAFEKPADVREEWLGLLTTFRARRVFQHPVWQQVWLEEFGRGDDALFLTVREGGRLAGLASLLREGEGVTFLGDYNICDYMDFVLAPAEEEAVLSAILDAILNEGWTEIALWGLRADSPTLALLPRLVEGRGLSLQVEEEAVCPQLALPASWEEYVGSLGKKNRHELRRKLRRFQGAAGEPALRSLCSAAEVEAGMDGFLGLMTLKCDKADFMTPDMDRFFRRAGVAMAGEGLARLYILELEGKRVAALFCFEDEEELLLYNSGYDPQYAHLSVGLLSKATCLRGAIEAGKRRFDFLRGCEPYKYDLGGNDLPVYRCLIKKG